MPSVVMPPAAIHEVLSELLGNAAAATQGRGVATVETRWDGDRFSIHVRDDGPGIPATSLTRLFSPGFTTKPRGSGLGLFLGRRLMEAHGGGLSVESVAAGMSFRIGMPIAGDHPGSAVSAGGASR